MKYRKDSILLFACIEKNIGDDLFIQTICNRYPGKRFIISNKAKYGSLREIDNLEFSKVLEWWLLFDSVSSSNIIKRCIAKFAKVFLRFVLGKHDIGVYIVGNAFKNTNYTDSTQLNWLKNRIALTKQFYLLSTNFGPYNDNRWKDEAHICFEQVTDICFRDLNSYNLFADLPNVRYAPDAILSLGKQCKEDTNKTILISVIDCNYSSRDIWLKKLSSSYENKIIEIIKQFKEKDYNVILINSNTEQDSPASKRIKSHFSSESVSVFDYMGDLNKLKELYSSAEYVIGTRLHTIILAWLFDIPVYPIVYDIKVENMLKSYSFKGEYTMILDIESLNVASIIKAFANYKGIERKTIDTAGEQFSILDKRLSDETR